MPQFLFNWNMKFKESSRNSLSSFFLWFFPRVPCFYENSLKFHRVLSFGNWVRDGDWTHGFTHARQMCHHWATSQSDITLLIIAVYLAFMLQKSHFQEITLKIPTWSMDFFHCLDLRSWDSPRLGPFSSDWASVNNKCLQNTSTLKLKFFL